MVEGSGACLAAAVDLAAVAAAGAAVQPAWSHLGPDLSLNLVVFDAGDGVEEHVNREVDVLLVGVLGSGTVTVDGQRHTLSPGAAIVVPSSARRATRAGTGRFAYLTCHRRRAPLLPTTRP